MADLPNNELFKLHAMRAVVRAFEHHPSPVTITFVDVLEAGKASKDDLKGEFRRNPDFRVAVDAIHWLVDEEYLRGHRHPTGVLYACLTSRAYLILNQADPLVPSRSLMSAIAVWTRETASQSAQASAANAASAAATGAFLSFLRSFGLS